MYRGKVQLMTLKTTTKEKHIYFSKKMIGDIVLSVCVANIKFQNELSICWRCWMLNTALESISNRFVDERQKRQRIVWNSCFFPKKNCIKPHIQEKNIRVEKWIVESINDLKYKKCSSFFCVLFFLCFCVNWIIFVFVFIQWNSIKTEKRATSFICKYRDWLYC